MYTIFSTWKLCHISPPSSTGFTRCPYVSLVVLTHRKCFHLINIPLLVYLVSVFPFLCASFFCIKRPSIFRVIFTVPVFLIPCLRLIPLILFDYTFPLSLLDCLPDLLLISCVPTIHSTQMYPS